MKDYERKEDQDTEPAEHIVAGRTAVLELLRCGRSVDKILLAKGAGEGSISLIESTAREARIPVVRADRAKLSAVSRGANHQGVVAYTAGAVYVSLERILEIAAERGEPPFVVLSDGIEDPHNLGALIRCAEGAGAHGVVIPKRRSAALTPVTVKSSAGACEHLAIAKVSNLASTIDALKEGGLWVYGAEADGTPVYEQDLRGPAAFVMGSEGKGLSHLIRQKCDFILSIPMYGKVNSFNVSTAAAVILCEAARQRNR